MLQELKTLFAQQAKQELLQTMREFHSCKQEEGQSVSSYVLKIKSYIDNLKRLRYPVTTGLGVSLILILLRKEFDGFMHNYNMHSMGKTINELHAMLKLHEQTLPKNNAPALHAIRARKETEASRFKLVRGQCQRAAVEAIGSYHLSLPSGLVIVLNNCHYAPSITRGIISISRLYDDGYANQFVDNSMQVSRNNMVYFSVVPRYGIFEIDLSYSYTNVSYIYALSNKISKSNLDSALLWHCHLGHISKKRIEKLQDDGLLNSTDLMAFEKSVPCISRKMARKPYSHQVERSKDLLGLIHTNVRGTFKIMSRQGASYFVTFTDDFSRYGYVYLLKHKHEVFETFKVFQKEVENQLGKTIKLLRSDRGSEYMSQEFFDHLKDHEIIAHRPPPYTLQHNDLEIIQEEDMHPSIDTSLNHEEDEQEIDEPQRDLGEPANYKATLLDTESDKWLNAMTVEMQSMKDNEVRDLVELPPNGKTIGSKWLFKKMTDMDGAVHTYKARLVAKGYTQTSRINYEETFSTVSDIRSIRILIAIAVFYNYEIWCFAMKDLGEAAYILGINIYRDRSRGLISLCQSAYTEKILKRYHMENSKRGSIPMQDKLRLSKSQGASSPAELKCMQNVPYTSAVGSIKYVVRCTFPDVAFAQNITSRYQQNPCDLHWTTKSTKQSIFATLSTKAKYIAAFDASKEAVWVRKFIYGLGVVPTIKDPISMYCDNTRAITIANESGITKGARHFRAKVHYLR
nr:retrotransposon protein, putative, Ty1-copia subclass [Tanacetum cinerariifolium]